MSKVIFVISEEETLKRWLIRYAKFWWQGAIFVAGGSLGVGVSTFALRHKGMGLLLRFHLLWILEV